MGGEKLPNRFPEAIGKEEAIKLKGLGEEWSTNANLQLGLFQRCTEEGASRSVNRPMSKNHANVSDFLFKVWMGEGKTIVGSRLIAINQGVINLGKHQGWAGFGGTVSW